MSEAKLIYHVPVLLNESVDGMNIQPGGIYVDATFGGGGHSKEILSRLDSTAHLYSCLLYTSIFFVRRYWAANIAISACSCFSFNIEVNRPAIFVLSLFVCSERRISSVSYTHLDVYKRQP